MPSTWTSFLRSNSGGSNGTPTRSSPAAGTAARDKPLPHPPEDHLDPPTLIGRDGERNAAPSPPRPRPHTAGGDRQHRHNRSASQPLPKIFGRKKSTGNLIGQQEADFALDNGLVPVLDEPQTSTPTRINASKRGRLQDEDESKLQMKCMCCASKVKVPQDLDKFRCLACLCINDLKPVENLHQPRDDDSDGKIKGKRTDAFPGGLMPRARVAHLSVERTKTIIERCVVAYLESRCRHDDGRLAGSKNPQTPVQTPEERENPLGAFPPRPRSAKDSSSQPPDAPVTASSTGANHSENATLPTNAPARDDTGSSAFVFASNATPPRDPKPTPHGSGPPFAIQRKPISRPPGRNPPPPPIALNHRTPSQKLHPNGMPSKGEPASRPTLQELEQRRHYDRVKTIFRAMEDYIVDVYGEFPSLNASFSTVRPTHTARARSESNIVTPPSERVVEASPSPVGLPQLDAKMLLLGDIGENSTWWTGKLSRNESDKTSRRNRPGDSAHRIVSSKSPNINWTELNHWYELVHSAGVDWRSQLDKVGADGTGHCRERLEGAAQAAEIESDLAQARDHAVRTLLKVTENMLKRPGRPLREPDDLRWLLIILANPSLYPSKTRARRGPSAASGQNNHIHPRKAPGLHGSSPGPSASPRKSAPRDDTQPHSGLLKRTFGLLASTNDTSHRYLIGWFARLDEDPFTRLVDLIGSFVTHRIARGNSRPRSRGMAADGGLIPDLSGSAMSTSAQLHSAMGLSGSVKKRADNPNDEPEYANDWQIKAGAKLMSLLFAANNIWQGKRLDDGLRTGSAVAIVTTQAKAKRSGQLLDTSSFYNTLLDYGDILADFKVWESKADRFAFCQYPFFLSMGSKIKILEYDARRQMEIKAREAYFDSVIRQRALDGFFHLRIRRDCMVDDSLRQISEAVGAGPEELKKGLRVQFTGEEGVDAGGLRKEWFLLLVRDIFDPNHGLFTYDDDSRTCYFNPNSVETSDQYYLVGALLGLAIYTSTILDIALPPFAFRKLLAAAPVPLIGAAPVSSLTGTKGQMTFTLADLAEFRPSLATGLRKLLEYEGDVQETYCWTFVAPVERYGTVIEVPLRPGGESTPVTNANRHEFVDAYIRYLLDTAVSRQFEPFKRGFFQVCAGNALSLFRAEEIELLVRGSDDAEFDVASLRAVAVYEGWRDPRPPHSPVVGDPVDAVPVLRWFWELFAAAPPARQRRLLSFVTGTDRIPAVGATSLVLRLTAGGDERSGGRPEDRERFPVARTCFNQLALYRYESREALAAKLWRAVEESEGFGLK